MTSGSTTRLLPETARFLLGLISLAALTVLCFWLDFRLVSVAFTYLILIALLSLAVSFFPLVALSIIAVGCLNYFFVSPIFAFRVEYPEDIIMLAAFLITSLIVTGLVTRMRAARDELGNVLDGIPALVWNTSSSGSAGFSNQRFRDYTGLSSEEVRGWGWMNALHPEDGGPEEWRAALTAGEPFGKEARVRKANGEHGWFLLRMMPLRDERGTILKWYGTGSDIDDRKRAEQALRRSEAYLADAQRISHTGSFAYNIANDRMVHSSEEHHRLFGFDPAAGIPASKEWAQRIHPDDREKAIDAMVQTLRERMHYEVAFRTLQPDGTIKHIHSVSHAVLGASGDLVDIVGTSTDVTERKRAEFLTAQVFQSSPDPITIIGKDYRYRRANPTYERIWGISVAKVVGMHVHDVVGREMFDRLVKPNLDRCFAGEEVSFAEWFNTAAGHKYWVVTYSPLRLESERVEDALVISRDHTEQMLAAEKLREAQIQLAHANRVATMGQLTASIAHEVNQPIGALVINAHAALRMLGAEARDLDEASQALVDIIKDGRRASDVIERIHALVKKKPPQTNLLDINEVIIETIALTRGEVLRNDISLDTQLAGELPFIRGDCVQLQQVFMNLVMNAVEAMSTLDASPRKLQIGTHKDQEDHILVTVCDSGPALKSETPERFFEAFYSTKSHGMGMGLSICRSIVEAHGGRIWATPNASRGVTFHIALRGSGETALQ